MIVNSDDWSIKTLKEMNLKWFDSIRTVQQNRAVEK